MTTVHSIRSFNGCIRVFCSTHVFNVTAPVLEVQKPAMAEEWLFAFSPQPANEAGYLSPGREQITVGWTVTRDCDEGETSQRSIRIRYADEDVTEASF